MAEGAPTSVTVIDDSGPTTSTPTAAAPQPHHAGCSPSRSATNADTSCGVRVPSQASREPGAPVPLQLGGATSAGNLFCPLPSTADQASPSISSATSTPSTASCYMDQERHRECSPGQIQCPYSVYACACQGTSQQIKEHCHTDIDQHLSMAATRAKALSDKAVALQRTVWDNEDVIARIQESLAAQFLEETPPTTPTVLTPSDLVADRRFLGAMKSTISDHIDAILAGKMADAHVSFETCQPRIKMTEYELNPLKQASHDGGRLQEQACPQLTQVDLEVNGNVPRQYEWMDTINYASTMTFTIYDFSRCHEDARNDIRTCLVSQIFSPTRQGYKACIHVCPNGVSAGEGSHVSVLFAIVRGEFDAVLEWPFPAKVTFAVLDQGSPPHHRIESFIPDPQSSSFQRPVNDMNIASGCPKMVSHSELYDKQSSYLRDDCLYIKVSVQQLDVDGINYHVSSAMMQKAHSISSLADTPTTDPDAKSDK